MRYKAAEKTMEKDDTILAFIGSMDESKRLRMLEIKSMIEMAVPTAEPSIAYAMPSYKYRGKPLVYFNAFARHIGVYALPVAHAQFAQQLGRYKRGKGSVQFPFDQPLPLDTIHAMVKYRQREIDQMLGA